MPEKTVVMADIGTQTYPNSNSTMIEDEIIEMSEFDVSVEESLEPDPLDTSFTPSSLGLGDTSFIQYAFIIT